METSLKTGFAQVFSCCPKNLSCPNFGGAAAPLAPPARTPMLVMWNMQTKQYHIIILDVNIITVLALSMGAMVVKLAHLA